MCRCCRRFFDPGKYALVPALRKSLRLLLYLFLIFFYQILIFLPENSIRRLRCTVRIQHQICPGIIIGSKIIRRQIEIARALSRTIGSTPPVGGEKQRRIDQPDDCILFICEEIPCVRIIIRRNRYSLSDITLRESAMICQTFGILFRQASPIQTRDVDSLRKRQNLIILSCPRKVKDHIRRLFPFRVIDTGNLSQCFDVVFGKTKGGIDSVIIHVLSRQVPACRIPHLLLRHLEPRQKTYGQQHNQKNRKVPLLLSKNAATRQFPCCLSLSHHSSSSAFFGCSLTPSATIRPD